MEQVALTVHTESVLKLGKKTVK